MAKSIALAATTPVIHTSTRKGRTRRLLVFVVAILIFVGIWEGAKSLFALPDYKLPHISTIFEVLTRPTPKGMTLWMLLGDTLYTGGEAVLGSSPPI
jgi:ABC-type nitrate/sulfonate/bicarbonate transport system permease component